jgi:hypothetical protein
MRAYRGSDINACLDLADINSIVVTDMVSDTTAITASSTVDGVGKTVIIRIKGNGGATGDAQLRWRDIGIVSSKVLNVRSVRLKRQDSSLSRSAEETCKSVRMTYINDASSDDIFGDVEVIRVVQLNAKLSNMRLRFRQGMEGLDSTTLVEKTLDLTDDGNGFDRVGISTTIEVDADNGLALKVGDLVRVLAFVSSKMLGAQRENPNTTMHGLANIKSILCFANISERNLEGATLDNLSRIDASQRGEQVGLGWLVG